MALVEGQYVYCTKNYFAVTDVVEMTFLKLLKIENFNVGYDSFLQIWGLFRRLEPAVSPVYKYNQ